ncbi:MAG: hypothetical protein PHF46_05155 [Candidatus Gracilibacteria bacterium]|nr:hypothetical protein [Candidatus Gracilibacteria bacterium]MDD3120763.1 hypothetical protein [Candidatus Gracilibacteria bacterium]
MSRAKGKINKAISSQKLKYNEDSGSSPEGHNYYNSKFTLYIIFHAKPN